MHGLRGSSRYQVSDDFTLYFTTATSHMDYLVGKSRSGLGQIFLAPGFPCPSVQAFPPQTPMKVFKQRNGHLRFVSEDDLPVAQYEGGQPNRAQGLPCKGYESMLRFLLGFWTERVNTLVKVRNHPGPSGLGDLVPIQFS